jgi:1-acyl-sn-glycerol-3-phosphate acyltransferase
VNLENIPADGTPLMIVSNHQNCLNDPLGILFALKDRKANFLARADVFKHPVANKFLRFIGLLPAFRMNFEGEAALGKNDETFSAAGKELMNGRTVVIYPEAGHQDKRWLGDFSLGYLRLAFGAAEKNNFEQDIFILPSCNHYSNYFIMQEELLTKYGKPISLAPYYELYKTKPRTVQREVNKLVREQISDLMLDVTDLENYEALDYLRAIYGKKYAERKGLNPDFLPDKLISDKAFMAEMETLNEKEGACIKELFRQTLDLKKATLNLKIRDWNFEKKFSVASILARGTAFLLLLPLFLVSLMPNILIFSAPELINRTKVTDKMFYGSIRIGLSVLFTIPVFYSLFFALCWIITGMFWIALIYLLILPFLGLFAWHYRKAFIKWKSEIRFHRLDKQGKMRKLPFLRKTIYSFLDENLRFN